MPRLSKMFAPLLREVPREAHTVSHGLLLRAGMLRRCGAGSFALLPLGLRVVAKAEAVVARVLEEAGCSRIALPILQETTLLERSGRAEAFGEELFGLQDRQGRDHFLVPTQEEAVTALVAEHMQDAKTSSTRLYQIGPKFRDEIRPRFGLMRAREFIMKDLYTFDCTRSEAEATYAEIKQAYYTIFAQLGLSHIACINAATGPIGGLRSEEFHVLADQGEDGLLSCPSCGFAANQETLSQESGCPACETREQPLQLRRGIEVGHLFLLGTRYSSVFGAVSREGPTKSSIPMEMGCFGIGISRILGAVVETNHDEHGIIWPSAIAPYTVSVVAGRTAGCEDAAARITNTIEGSGLQGDVLRVDTEKRVSGNMKVSQLIGVPWIVIVGGSFLKNAHIEVENRSTGEKHQVREEDLPLFMHSVLKG